jgi:hypothetical protein
MKSFAKLAHLTKKDEPKSSDSSLTLYNSNGIIITKNNWSTSIFDTIHFIRHFGLFQFLRLKRWLVSLTNEFEKFLIFNF